MTQTNEPRAPLTSLPPPAPLTPHLVIAGAKGALAFYERAFGAEVRYLQETPDDKVMHADVRLPNGGVFYVCDDFSGGNEFRPPVALGGTPVTIHLELQDVDEAWQRAVGAGAKIEMPLADQFWGARYGVLSDPFGHRWSLGKQKT